MVVVMINRFIYYSIIILLLTLFTACSSVQTKKELVGPINLEEWKNSKYWNEKTYQDYEPNTQNIDLLQLAWKRNNFKIIIFASIYCDDCIETMPIFYKIFEYSKFKNENIIIYGLDEYSTEPTGFYKKFKIDKTPAVFLEFTDGQVFQVSKAKDWLESIIQIWSRKK